jgi:signal transduction histidine kinase
VDDAIANGRQYRAVFRIRRPDGAVRWLLNLGRAQYDSDGRPLRMLGVVQDITDRKTTEQELARAYSERDAVVLAVAHELRNYVHGVGTTVAVLRQDRATPDQRDMALQRLQRQSDSMVRLVADLLDVSKMAMGHLTIKFGPVALRDVVEDALYVVRPEIGRRAQKLTVDLPEEHLMLRGDAVRLCQVLANVLLNAAKYTPDGGSVQLVARRRGIDVQIDVTDTGKGIEPEHLPTVFDLYSQVDRHSSGLGIGLYMARQLVERHGGSISATSKGLGHGTTFTIVLTTLDS